MEEEIKLVNTNLKETRDWTNYGQQTSIFANMKSIVSLY